LTAAFLGLVVAAANVAAGPADPIELRLLSTIYTGTWQEVDAAAALRHAHDSHEDFVGHVLARSALLVMGEDHGFPDWPLERLLDRVLEMMIGTHAFAAPRGLPAGFDGPQVVFAMVHALVTTRQAAQAEDVLERHLATGARFKHAVVLQALRNIGDARSTSLLQRFAEQRDDQNLAENLLADQQFPFLDDLARRLSMIPPSARGRSSLLATAGSEGCGERQALAVYFLGYLSPSRQADVEARERSALEMLARAPCFTTRYFAARAVALRWPQTLEFWMELFDQEPDAWQRAHLARIGFARFRRSFLRPALERLGREPSQYVQWELMHGNLEVREGARFRTYWDIWAPPTLQFHLNFPDGAGSMSMPDADELLDWLESGARPRDLWVRNHLLYGLARHVSGESARRFLRVFDSLPDKTRHFWVLSPLPDPKALPLLRYWLTLPIAEAAQRKSLEDLVELLETRSGSAATSSSCCLATPECVLDRVRASAPAPSAITTEQEARRWLSSAGASATRPGLRFLDPLERVAVARWPDGREERWEHLYGCWRRADPQP
jgi:hypothetical protein